MNNDKKLIEALCECHIEETESNCDAYHKALMEYEQWQNETVNNTLRYVTKRR